MGKRQKRNKSWVSLVLNFCRHCKYVTFDARLFQVLAAATRNAQSPIVHRCVSGTASAKVDDKNRRCQQRSPVTGCRPTRIEELNRCLSNVTNEHLDEHAHLNDNQAPVRSVRPVRCFGAPIEILPHCMEVRKISVEAVNKRNATRTASNVQNF